MSLGIKQQKATNEEMLDVKRAMRNIEQWFDNEYKNVSGRFMKYLDIKSMK